VEKNRSFIVKLKMSLRQLSRVNFIFSCHAK